MKWSIFKLIYNGQNPSRLHRKQTMEWDSFFCLLCRTKMLYYLLTFLTFCWKSCGVPEECRNWWERLENAEHCWQTGSSCFPSVWWTWWRSRRKAYFSWCLSPAPRQPFHLDCRKLPSWLPALPHVKSSDPPGNISNFNSAVLWWWWWVNPRYISGWECQVLYLSGYEM